MFHYWQNYIAPVKRKSEIQECKQLLADESTDHLHIRRKAIVSEFTNNLLSDLDDCKIVTVEIYEWEYDELMETLRADLQKELSRLKYYYSEITSGGLTLFGFGATGGAETRPDYTRTTDYLQDVSNKSDEHLVVFIEYNGDRPVGNFGWIPKLDIPEDATIITDGFSKCGLDDSEEYSVERLRKEQAVDYLTDLRSDISESEAAKIHEIHDGNPVGIEIANERGSLQERLTGDALRELWSRVYADKISGEEFDLLTGSSHLIDLDQRDVASVTDKTRGEAKQLLEKLESKGVVSEKQSGLFTTDKYVKRYTATQLTGQERSKQHLMSFHDYVEKWMDSYESRVQEMRNKAEGQDGGERISPPDLESGLTDPNLFLAIHHLSEIHDDMDKETFVEDLEEIDAETSGVFAFGMIAQRFFFEDPMEVLQELSESILSIEEEIENERFSGTMSILFGFDLREYISQLSDGWSGDINTEVLDTTNASEPDKVVKKIQTGIDAELYQELPPDVKMAIAYLVALAVTDRRTGKEFFNRFGRTAENHGLKEEAFCQWLEELEKLVDELNPDSEDADADWDDIHEESLDALNSEIRNRLDLREYLEANQSQAQGEFQRRIEEIRSKPDEIAEQYIQCGEQLVQAENSLFHSCGMLLVTIYLPSLCWEVSIGTSTANTRNGRGRGRNRKRTSTMMSWS